GAEVATGERELRESRAALASAIGVPVSELDRSTLAIEAVDRCGDFPRDSLLRLALKSRPALRRVLAEYQMAEAEVRLEVANSWPDLQLGPGLFFDHGVGKWTIGFGLPSLPLHGNRGPIGEAEARRAVAAARVNETQEQILGEVEQAIAGCAAATTESKALDDAGVRRRLQLVEAAYLRGEAGQLDLDLARLDVARAERQFATVQGRVALAWLSLERAIGLWDSTAAVSAEREGK
ncbi:MAG: TolC family protein, partial [Gemmatimonadota bacterium]